MCHSIAHRYYADGHTHDDLAQAAFIGFAEAIENYNEKRGSTFASFAFFCAERKVQTCVKMARAQKHSPITTAASLDAPVADDMPSMQVPGRMTPERIIESRETFQALCVAVDADLTASERQSVIGIAAGLTYHEIPGEYKVIDNALQRARQKLAPLAA